MTGVDVEHTKALEAAATPGPWCVETEDRHYENVYIGGEWLPDIMSDGLMDRTDAEFIAHARTVVPALVAAVERVQALHTPINAADYGVRNRGAITQVCTGCGQDDGNWQYWPCPTIRALETQ